MRTSLILGTCLVWFTFGMVFVGRSQWESIGNGTVVATGIVAIIYWLMMWKVIWKHDERLVADAEFRALYYKNRPEGEGK